MTTVELERFYAKNSKLGLLQFSAVDAEPLFALIDRNREHLSQFGDTTSAKYPTLASVLDSILHPPNPSRLRFGIWREKMLLGTINLTSVGHPDNATIGYWVGREFTRQRVATEALKAMVQYAAMEKGHKKLIASTHIENFRSQLVLRRVGFRIEHQVEDAYRWILQY